MKGCIITIKGNKSGSRKPSIWLVVEAVNADANDVANEIAFASVTGSIGSKSTNNLVNRICEVKRLCNHCRKPAGVYGAGHEECFKYL